MTSLYIHIPFCARKCAYCDFVSFPGREKQWAAYLLALEEEMKAAARAYGRLPLQTIFIGGGTPSLLDSDAVSHLLAMCRALFAPDPQAEITVECNPGTLSPEKLRDYRWAGVNRISLGMQAAQPRLLHTLGRIHNQGQVIQAVEWARQAGFDNINLDLMYALPGQSMADWVETLKAALSLSPQHLSLYSLILEPGTPLAAQVEAGALTLPGEDACLAMEHGAQRILARRGYARYEISNYAQPGRECRHNMTYWTRGDYLGLGLAAHSFMGGARLRNTSDLEAYLAGRWTAERQIIPPQEAWEEAVMLGTRLTQGIDMALLQQCPETVDQLTELGLAETVQGRFRLTTKGMDVQNAVVLELIRHPPAH